MSTLLARFLAALIVAVAMSACAAESTAPRSTRSARHPLIGVYDVTTTIDSFTTDGGSHCGLFALHCPVTHASTGAFLAGTATIGDSIVRVDTILSDSALHLLTPPPLRETTFVRLPIASATFVGRECAHADPASASGCDAFTDTVRADYPVVLEQIVTPEPPGDQRRFTLELATVAVSRHILTFSVTRSAGDTIWGTVQWVTAELAVPPRFSGTFRAVQRP